MRQFKVKAFLLVWVCLWANLALAQLKISGTVSDALTGETIPMILVDVPGTQYKTQTDFDGNYSLVINEAHDSIRATCFGYLPGLMPIDPSKKEQVINILLKTEDQILEGVVIEAPENPAFPIMRKVMDNKKKNDPRALQAYQYEIYSKSQIDVDNISDKFREKKFSKKLGEVLDSSGTVTDEYGNEVIPVFISETLSDFYYTKKPLGRREYVKAVKVTGIGVQDESFFAQLMGATFQDANFYENGIDVAGKEFISPITSAWKSTYHFVLIDSMFVIDGELCYQLELKPKRPQDLAFDGNIWVTKTDYALKRVDLKIPKEANLNFIEGIDVFAEWTQTDSGPWLMTTSKVLVDVAKNTPSMLLKLNTQLRDLVIDQPKEKSFYELQLEVAEDATEHDNTYWEENRRDTLNAVDQQSFQIIDSLNNTPVIKTYVDVIDFIFFGYKRVGKLDIGPYIYTYAYNEIEGHRFRVGLRTNPNFSKKFELSGYGAYGSDDEKFKYKANLRYIANRKRWTEFGLSHKYELEQLGLTDKIDDQSNNVAFKVFTQWGKITGGYYNEVSELYAFRQLNRNFSQKLTVRTWKFDPTFDFSYYTDDTKTEVTNQIETAEVVLRTHFGRNELFVQKGNNRYSLGVQKLPLFDVQYTYGLSTGKSEFDYHKIEALLWQNIGVNAWGNFVYALYGGKVINPVPYPLLNVHLGNEFPIYNEWSFSLMNFFEFVSDEYASVRLEHHFNGFILNRIPLLRKLKWRTVVNFNTVWGRVSDDNLDLLAPQQTEVSSLEDEPYMEVGYGVENIFRLLRVQMFHRLNYLDKEGVDKWGIKIGMQFEL